MIRKTCVMLLSILIVACNQQNIQESIDETTPKSGVWRGVIALNDSIDLPFNFELNNSKDDISITIYNADERVEATVSKLGEDSIKIMLPVFATHFVARVGATELTGSFINPDGDNYILPFKATYGDSSRFVQTEPKCCSINDKWAVKFRPGQDNERPAIAYFEDYQDGIKGTFVTETGDYRYLQGVLSGNKLMLSSFDGGNLYVFTGEVNSQEIEGLHYSGRSSVKPWIAYRDDSFTLRDADSLTFLKEGYSAVGFSFEDLKGSTVSLNDEQFQNKPVIVQIMGSWCANCMDESRYLTEVYNRYKKDGLRVIGLTFEHTKSKEIALLRAQKMVDDIEIPYPVLLAGATREDRAADKLPMLNHVMSYPTSIYLNADHSVRKIHTGFAGPGTPLYEEFVKNDRQLIEEMLATQIENK